MSDLIKREDAIKALRKLGHEVVAIDKVCSLGVAAEFIDAIRAIPSADTFEITKEALIEAIDNAETVGDIIEEFITANRPQEKCEFCKDGGFIGARLILGNDKKWHKILFCPNCGADMREREGE